MNKTICVSTWFDVTTRESREDDEYESYDNECKTYLFPYTTAGLRDAVNLYLTCAEERKAPLVYEEDHCGNDLHGEPEHDYTTGTEYTHCVSIDICADVDPIPHFVDSRELINYEIDRQILHR